MDNEEYQMNLLSFLPIVIFTLLISYGIFHAFKPLNHQGNYYAPQEPQIGIGGGPGEMIKTPVEISPTSR